MIILKFCSLASKSRLINVPAFFLRPKSDLYALNCSRYLSACKTRRGPPWRILFFGSDDFSLKSLQFLCSKYRTGTLISKLEVITSSASNLIGRFAQEEKLDHSFWPVEDSVLNGQFDLGIVVSFGHLIPAKVINAFPLGIINAHASLLPRWRGASPIVYALMNGDHETGVTIMKIKPKKLDVGDIVRQYRCPIAGNETYQQLRERLALHSAELLMECLRDLPKCLDMSQPQPEDGITYAPKLNKNLSNISWETMTSREIYNKHRALSQIYPLTTKWTDHIVKFLNVAVDSKDFRGNDTVISDIETIQTASALSFLNVSRKKDHSLGTGKSAVSFLNSTVDLPNQSRKLTNDYVQPGLVSYDKYRNVLCIMCCDGKRILVNEVLVVGKKSMSGADFNNGFLSKISDKSKRVFSDC